MPTFSWWRTPGHQGLGRKGALPGVHGVVTHQGAPAELVPNQRRTRNAHGNYIFFAKANFSNVFGCLLKDRVFTRTMHLLQSKHY